MKRNYEFLDGLKRGQYFPKKAYVDQKLNTYEEVKHRIPQPILAHQQSWIDCYDFSVRLLFSNTHKPTQESGYVSNFVDAAFNDDIFLWDTAFMTLFCNLLHPFVPGISSLDNFYCKQFDDGEIPREMVRETGKDFLLWVNAYDSPLYSYFHNHYGHRRLKALTNLAYEDMYQPAMGRVIEKNPYLTLDNLNHPILAFAEWQSYCHTKDIDRLRLVFEPLYHYYAALKYHLRHANGLYVTDWASMDNSPRNAHLGCAIDTSCEMVLFARNLLSIMDVITTVKDGELRRKELYSDIETLCKLINDTMWNEEDGFYYDLTFEGKQTKIKTIAAYFALIAGVADKEKTEKMVGWLEDPDTFKRTHRVPVLAANEKGFDPQGGYWSGSVWAPTNAIVVLGLEQWGYHELAREIALNHLEVIGKVFEDTGSVWENYPADFISSGNADKKDFVGWSGIAPILYLIQYAIGLSPDPTGDGLIWEIREEEVSKGEVGCKNYWFANKTGDFLATKKQGKLQIDIHTADSFDLKLIYQDHILTLTIDGDLSLQLD